MFGAGESGAYPIAMNALSSGFPRWSARGPWASCGWRRAWAARSHRSWWCRSSRPTAGGCRSTCSPSPGWHGRRSGIAWYRDKPSERKGDHAGGTGRTCGRRPGKPTARRCPGRASSANSQCAVPDADVRHLLLRWVLLPILAAHLPGKGQRASARTQMAVWSTLAVHPGRDRDAWSGGTISDYLVKQYGLKFGRRTVAHGGTGAGGSCWNWPRR